MRIDNNAYHPTLKFRYHIEFEKFSEIKFAYFSGYSVENPKWTILNGWRNPISIKFYRFEVVDAIENLIIDLLQNPLNNRFKINFVNPSGAIIGYWDVTGDIEVCDFGEMTWKDDDVLSLELKILPIDCVFVNLIKSDDKA